MKLKSKGQSKSQSKGKSQEKSRVKSQARAQAQVKAQAQAKVKAKIKDLKTEILSQDRPSTGAHSRVSLAEVGGGSPEGLQTLKYGVLFRPERMAYVRKKLPQDKECVFCRAARLAPSKETLCVYRSELSMVVLNKFPYNPGHLLVLPRRHVGSIQDLTDQEWLDLNHLLRVSAKALELVYEPQGLNIGMNHGASAGAGIPDHLHYHLIPRWRGDTNFFPLMTQTKVIVEDLAVTYSRVSEKINQII
jgi:ATP adenylyltransferase